MTRPARVVRRRPTHSIDMHHPAFPSPPGRLMRNDTISRCSSCCWRCHPLVQPGYKGAVLAHDHAVIDHGGVIEQIGQAGILARCF